MTEIVESTGKGFGALARKDLSAGRRVIHEPALITSEECTPIHIHQLIVELGKINCSERDWFTKLTHVGQLPFVHQEAGIQETATTVAS
jgi:hypothetical protein